jgi:hypothetical protein
VGADRQAEAGAAETAGGGAVGLFEGLEQAGDFVRLMPTPVSLTRSCMSPSTRASRVTDPCSRT